jgi:pimeloyl-ACP methyl ester carboxylesterase
LTQPDISLAELAKISTPTLIMCGDYDTTQIEHTVRLYKTIKGAKLCVVPRTTHMLLLERPRMVNETLLDFLNGTE